MAVTAIRDIIEAFIGLGDTDWREREPAVVNGGGGWIRYSSEDPMSDEACDFPVYETSDGRYTAANLYHLSDGKQAYFAHPLSAEAAQSNFKYGTLAEAKEAIRQYLASRPVREQKVREVSVGEKAVVRIQTGAGEKRDEDWYLVAKNFLNGKENLSISARARLLVNEEGLTIAQASKVLEVRYQQVYQAVKK